MLHCTWMVCWIANNTRLFRANCFQTDRVISNWNRCSHIHWPIYLLHWNMDQKTEIRSYIKCRIRLNLDSEQIFNELCGIYGPETISVKGDYTILWRFVIKICLIKRSAEVIRTQWQNFLQDPRILVMCVWCQCVMNKPFQPSVP